MEDVMKRLSQKGQNYPPSGIRIMFELAKNYPDAIKLTVGEPNFDTPAFIKEAAKKALDAGETHYTPNAGVMVLREAVAKKYQKTHWEGYTAEHVMITVGAMEGLMLTMMMRLSNPSQFLLTVKLPSRTRTSQPMIHIWLTLKGSAVKNGFPTGTINLSVSGISSVLAVSILTSWPN